MGRSDVSKTRVLGPLGGSDSTFLHKIMEIDRPQGPKTRVLDTSDGQNRPPAGSRAFQRLRKAPPLPHGFAIWQDRAPYASKWHPRLGMGSSFQKWCCGLGQGTVWPVQASKTPRRTRKRPEVLSEQGPKCSKSLSWLRGPNKQIKKKRRLLVDSQ